MRAGYGRGYYGVGQLARPPQRRRGSVWTKVALVVGVGAVIWLMWPRSKPEYEPESGRGSDEPKPPPPSPLPLLEGASAQSGQPAQLAEVAQTAEVRGYPSQQAYEDAVIASARQLQTLGAKVVLAPHLAHLAPRLES
jgi:hypothetical protein